MLATGKSFDVVIPCPAGRHARDRLERQQPAPHTVGEHVKVGTVGRTPVVNSTGARFSANMISAVTAKGALRFAVYDTTLTAKVFINFCGRSAWGRFEPSTPLPAEEAGGDQLRADSPVSS